MVPAVRNSDKIYTTPTVKNSDKIYMLAATVSRMVAGLGTFVLLAHSLSPLSFGAVATVLAYCTFANIVSDFGLAVWSQRTASANADLASNIVTIAGVSKSVLVVVAGVILLPIALWKNINIVMVIFLYAGSVSSSISDILLVFARVNRRFDVEAKLTSAFALLWLVGIGTTAWITQSAVYSAMAFGITRILYFYVTSIMLRNMGLDIFKKQRFSEVISTYRSSSGYAVDSILTSLSSQIDVLLFAVFLSLASMGIYQAGARLVQVVIPFAVVLSTVYLTPMTRAFSISDFAAFKLLSRRVTFEFLGFSVIGFFGFLLLGPFVSSFVYGPRYEQLRSLWPGFALFALMRFTAAGFGIQLVAVGAIKLRIVSQVVSMALLIIATIICLPRYGLSVTSWVLALSAIPSLAISASGCAVHKGDRRAILVSVSTVLILLSICAAIFLSGGAHVPAIH